MKTFFRNAKLMFAIGMAFGMSKGVMNEAMGGNLSQECYEGCYDPCEDPYLLPYLTQQDLIDYGCVEAEDPVAPGGLFTAPGGTSPASSPSGVVGRAGGGGGGKDDAGALAVFDNVSIALDAQFGDIHDALLGGDGSDANATLWIDSFSGAFRYGLGLTYDYYRVNDRYDVNMETYAADFYLTWDINENLYIGGFLNLSMVDTHEATFAYKGGTISIGGTEGYYGAGILAGYNYTYQEYTFNVNSVIASMLNQNLGDLIEEDDTQWYNSASVYRPITDQLAAEIYAGWAMYFDRSGGRDQTVGNVGGNVIYTITDQWSASVGLETDFAQKDFEGNYLNLHVRYDW